MELSAGAQFSPEFKEEGVRMVLEGERTVASREHEPCQPIGHEMAEFLRTRRGSVLGSRTSCEVRQMFTKPQHYGSHLRGQKT
ncbi:hypothetical protein ACBJ59_57560 [Nonomuraea sp. MTCD27]|uniref:hypothetical protein n=1 Tax=Nonomuraea sp. MTCD27 TaxID=1676747 RepID=UPI0035C0167E